MTDGRLVELQPSGAVSALVGAGDLLAYTALKALLEGATSIDGQIATETTAELSDAVHAWTETRRTL